MTYHIAVDIGASSGRLVLGGIQDGSLALEELHRFPNAFLKKEDGSFRWDIDELLRQILAGLHKAKESGVGSCTLGIDTWGVDYALIAADGTRVEEVYSYRDHRTDRAMAALAERIPPEAVYAKTGIQQLPFNTLYQLSVHDPGALAKAERILLVPDYLYYRLTGMLMNESTNASTTQLLNLETRDFDADLLALLGLRREQFAALAEPGTEIGPILPELVREYDLPQCRLIAAATHDTASAVLGAPLSGERTTAFLSSGTWSLIGLELDRPVGTPAAREANYTNEWGAYGTFRFLKNVMGMWLVQEVRRLLDNRCSFAELVQLAEGCVGFRSLIPCSDERFLSPDDMIGEVRAACAETGQPVPQTPGELARCIYDSLALSYRSCMEELEALTGERIETLRIVGGGAHNRLLCQLTADVLGKDVSAGPTESTALGNLAVQMISAGVLPDIREARELIGRSFPAETYRPQPIPGREEILNRWKKLNRPKVAK